MAPLANPAMPAAKSLALGVTPGSGSEEDALSRPPFIKASILACKAAASGLLAAPGGFGARPLGSPGDEADLAAAAFCSA